MARFSATVCVPHVDTLGLLSCCLENILHFEHPDVDVEVIVADQSDPLVKLAVKTRFDGRRGAHTTIRVIDCERIDAGYPLDVAVRQASGEFFCSLDCDAWPITAAWLASPIEQIVRRGHSLVGCDCDLHAAYEHYGPFRAINNFYRVSWTDVALRASKAVGFMRPVNRDKADIEIGDEWPFHDWCDNGVAANWWIGKTFGHSTLPLPVTRILGRAHDRPDGCVYGLVIDEKVFHLGYGYYRDTVGGRAKMLERMGPRYLGLYDSFEAVPDHVEHAAALNRAAQEYAFIGW